MIRCLFRSRCDASAPQMFFGASLVFMWGAAMSFISPVISLLVWAFVAITVIRWTRHALDDRRTRAARAEVQATWDAKWASWGGRIPEQRSAR